ncbi:MAG: glutathione S-transferase family protein [Bauldia sp.]|nr:glutathione S-transferase family protein [Bauldia sp.]
MGRVIDGAWHTDGQTAAADGRFRRAPTMFHNWVTADGSPGPTGESGFKAERGRYHLYFAKACPWAHRTMIFRKLKKLETLIAVSEVEARVRDEGWEFSTERPDAVNGKNRLYEVYLLARADYTGRASVPVLWDKHTQTIVNNESSEIIRMFNSAFDAVGGDGSVDFYPAPLRAEIDRINAVVYETVNDGVYRAGFARTQAAYDEAVTALFTTLDMLDERLAASRYLVGDRVTEADWRLFTTLVRFDPVYVGHFKCNIRRIEDYPNLSGYLRELYQHPHIAGTFDLDSVKRHYYQSHRSLNPRGIVPLGPTLDLTTPHGRERLKAA